MNNRMLGRFKWGRLGNLYLPSSIIRQRRAVSSINLPIAEVITAGEVLKRMGNEKQLRDLCQDICWKDCLLYISKLAAFLEKYGYYDPDIQCKLVAQIFDTGEKQEITRLITNSQSQGIRVLINEWQLLLLAKSVLLYSSDNEDKRLDSQSQKSKFGECLLILNDLVASGSGSKIFNPNSEDDMSKYDMSEDDMKESLIRVGAFSRGESYQHLLTRYHDLFRVLPNEAAMAKSPNFMDIEATFNYITGLRLDMFFALGFGFLAKFYPVQNFETSSFIINSNTFFSKTVVPVDTANKTISRLSISRDEFMLRHADKYEDKLGNYFDFTIFKQQPLVRLDDSHNIPVNVRFLVQRISSGIYWDILDGLDGQNKEKFMRFFGDLLQQYVSQLFKRVYPESIIAKKRAFYDETYGIGNKTSDVIILYGNEAVFLEVTVGRLRMERTMIPGNIHEFRDDVETKIVSACKQLDRVIKDFKCGKLSLENWNYGDVHRYYPVVITAEPLPLLLSTYEEVRKLIAKRNYLQESDLAPLEIWSTEELEMIETLLNSGETIVSLLKDKLKHPIYKNLSMKDYLNIIGPSIFKQKKNVYISRRFGEIDKEIRRLLFGVTSDTLNS